MIVKHKTFHLLVNKNTRSSYFRLYDEENREIRDKQQFINASIYCYSNYKPTDKNEISNPNTVSGDGNTILYIEISNRIEIQLYSNYFNNNQSNENNRINNTSNSSGNLVEKRFIVNDIEIEYPNIGYSIRKANLLDMITRVNGQPEFTKRSYTYILQCIRNNIIPTNIRFRI